MKWQSSEANPKFESLSPKQTATQQCGNVLDRKV
jgi:hypothetical protein